MKANDSSEIGSTWKYVGWAGAVLVILGYYFNANKIEACWLVWIVGNGGMAIYCFKQKAYPAMIMSFVIMAMNIYGLMKWAI